MTATTAPCTFSSTQIIWAYDYPVDSCLAGLKLGSEFFMSSQVKLMLVVMSTLNKEDVSYIDLIFASCGKSGDGYSMLRGTALR